MAIHVPNFKLPKVNMKKLPFYFFVTVSFINILLLLANLYFWLATGRWVFPVDPNDANFGLVVSTFISGMCAAFCKVNSGTGNSWGY